MLRFGFILLLLTACQTSSERLIKEYEAIQLGMNKSEVLHVAGNPAWSDRMDGQDRWIYYLNPQDQSSEQIVFFENGKVVSKGPRNKPELSAEEMDQLKENELAPHKPKYSDEELKSILKKEVEREKSKKHDHFEKI